MAKAKKERRSDRLSELPDNVIDHIMSFLEEVDIAFTAVSSKTWRRVRSTHPVLNIHQSTFTCHKLFRYTSTPSEERLVKKFTDFVYQALRRFLQSNVNLEKFKLCVFPFPYYINHLRNYNEWIHFAFVYNNVAKLELCFHSPSRIPFFLPPTLISSKSLTVLILRRCELFIQNFSTNPQCESLRELTLVEVRISEYVIQSLINRFPCIENFALKHCEGFNYLRLCNLNKLKNVEVRMYRDCGSSIKSIHIDALSLHSFKLLAVGWDHYYCHINLDTCRNLQVLHFQCLHLPTLFFETLCSNFPILRTLVIIHCYGSESIRVVSQSLESLTLDSVDLDPLVNATIDTPNLHSFNYCGNLDKLFLFSMDTPRVREATIDQGSIPVDATLFFSKMRAFIGKLGEIRILSLRISTRETFDLEEVQHIPIPQLCHVKHLKLFFYSLPSTYAGIVDGILWCFHPETLSIEVYSKSEADKNFIKALYGELMERRRMQNCCKPARLTCGGMN